MKPTFNVTINGNLCFGVMSSLLSWLHKVPIKSSSGLNNSFEMSTIAVRKKPTFHTSHIRS